MKGKKLTIKEIIKLPHGTKVWNEDEFESGVSYVNQDEKYISCVDDMTSIGWEFNELEIFYGKCKIYEWIEDKQETPQPKVYKASEIIAMIEENKLMDEDFIIDKDGDEWDLESISKIDDMTCRDIINYAPFTIKERLIPVDFNTAANSGKKIKPLSLKDEKDYHPYTYWLGFMVSEMAHGKQPLDYINGQWLIENKLA